ncbi:MAG: hypothetical protein OQK78_07915 [Gammaproteobacteria bacterium]|nr:hypothetical protein [Gammaproteobacteria bacterium]
MAHHCEPDIEQKFHQLLHREGIEADLSEQLYSAYLPVAKWVARQPQPFVVGINGAQGSGKSTLSQILKLLLQQQHRLNVATLSIDDLYKSHAERQLMAHETHPLFATRGVPGTHDLSLGTETIRSLLSDETTTIPRFDKLTDNPKPRSEWPLFEGVADVVIFEGWCIGATPQHEELLSRPVNSLEQLEDPDGGWRRFVNRQLQHHYPALFEPIDALIMLEIPQFEKVQEWRSLQESKLSADNENLRPMDSEEMERFIMHFERLTRHMLAEMPERADILLSLNHKHQIDKIKFANNR